MVLPTALNDNLPKPGDLIIVTDPALAALVAEHLRTTQFKVAGLHGQCVALVAAQDYYASMPVPTSVQEALQVEVRYFGVRLRQVRVSTPA